MSSSAARPLTAASTRGSPVGAGAGRARSESVMFFPLLRSPGIPAGTGIRYPPA
jgi:hypothetical protein